MEEGTAGMEAVAAVVTMKVVVLAVAAVVQVRVDLDRALQ
jgi:hypothetical protein